MNNNCGFFFFFFLFLKVEVAVSFSKEWSKLWICSFEALPPKTLILPTLTGDCDCYGYSVKRLINGTTRAERERERERMERHSQLLEAVFSETFKKKRKKKQRFGESRVKTDDARGSWGHRLCMGSLLGRDTNGLPERPLGPHFLQQRALTAPFPAGRKILPNLCIRG